MTAKTSQHLADTLRAAGFASLAQRAERDEFHDFLGHGLPSLALDNALVKLASDPTRSERERLAAHHIRMRHHEGEFDASTEESENWAAGEEGQSAIRRLIDGK